MALLLLPIQSHARDFCLDCHQPHYSNRGNCTLCHRGNPATARKNLAHAGLIKGSYARFMTADSATHKEWNSKITAYGCRRCHRLDGEGNSLAADLDLIARKKTPDELVAAIRHPVKAMPDFSFSDATLEETVTALLAAAAGNRQIHTAQRQVVHFEPSGSGTEDVFSKKCGGCHRALTKRYGSLGRGDTAPNLSGLFSPYYPGSYTAGKRWNKERLKQWLKNPRKIRKTAGMQPVEVSAAEFREIQTILVNMP